MNILILGGTGFLGYNLSIGFQESDYKIINVDKQSISDNTIGKFYNKNIKRNLNDIIKKEKPEVLYILTEDPNRYKNENMLYYLNLDIYDNIKIIQSLSKIKHNIKKIIIGSWFDLTHDNCSTCNHLNKYELNTLNPQFINKFTMEMYLQYFKKRENINFVSLRFPQIYGYKKFEHWSDNIVDSFINKTLQNKTIHMNKNEHDLINLLYVGDAISALIFSLKDEISGIYNITGDYYSYVDIITTINKYHSIKASFNNNKEKSKPKKIFRTNSFQPYGWSPIVSLTSGINVTYNHIIKKNDF